MSELQHTIDEIVDEFREAWRQRHVRREQEAEFPTVDDGQAVNGSLQPPQVETALEGGTRRHGPEIRSKLLQALIEEDRFQHGRWSKRWGGEIPGLREYRQRFPDMSDQGAIDRALDGHNSDESERAEKQSRKALPYQAIGKFQIRKELGVGGCGSVYLGFDPVLEREVALKVPKRASKPLLWREAKATAKLEHRAIVRLYDVHCEESPDADPPVYIEMQYIAGTTLDAEIKAGLTPDRVVDVMLDVVEAVDFAHRKGVFHRDLKPANILLDVNGRPYVADFGLAIHEQSQHLHREEFSGTVQYMSPEQIKGQPCTAADDIWSLGVVFYQSLTGELPVCPDGAQVNQRAPEQELVSPSSLRPAIPHELARICLKCLALEPRDRYQKAAQLGADLQAWKTSWLAGPASGDRRSAIRLERRALQDVRAGLPSEALPVLEKSLQLYPDNADAHYLSGLCHLMSERITEGVKSFQESTKLNPDHAAAHFALATVYCEVRDYDSAMRHAARAIASSPANQTFRQIQDRIRLLANSNETAIVVDVQLLSTDPPPELKRRLSDFARSALARDVSQVELHHWSVFFYPWRMLREAPLRRSLLFAIAGLLLVLSLQTLEWSTARAIQQTVIWVLIWLGLYVPFVTARLLERTYNRLLPAITMPEDAFRRFFIRQCAHLLGGSCAIDPTEVDRFGSKAKSTGRQVLVALAFLGPLLYLQYICAKDHPDSFTLAAAARYASYVLEAYALVWIMPLAIFGLSFIPEFSSVPLRFFLGMPESASLKCIGGMFLSFTAIGAVGYFFFMLQHYVFRTHDTSAGVSLTYIALAVCWLTSLMVVSQWRIYLAMQRLKNRRLVEYSYHLEEAFERVMKNPTRDAFESLSDHRRFMASLDELDAFGLTRADIVKLVFIAFILFGLSAVYTYLVAHGLWLV